MKAILLLTTLLALAACVPPSTSSRPVAPVAAVAAPANDDYVWARKDGRRMAGNPELYQQGALDRQTCSAQASTSGTLDFPVFASCMDRAGYIQMRKSG
jgi:hypothetical protein